MQFLFFYEYRCKYMKRIHDIQTWSVSFSCIDVSFTLPPNYLDSRQSEGKMSKSRSIKKRFQTVFRAYQPRWPLILPCGK